MTKETEEKEKDEKREEELRRAQDQLKKCVDDEDYRGAAAAKANLTALMNSVPYSRGIPSRSKADLLRRGCGTTYASASKRVRNHIF